MFERYTEHARRALFFSREEATLQGAASIEPGHLLLGLIREEGHVAAKVLHAAHLPHARFSASTTNRNMGDRSAWHGHAAGQGTR
jgi:ATP-dependent Clp protease ATP-binding subunit ClpA